LEGKEEASTSHFTALAPPHWDGLVIYRPSPQGWTTQVLKRKDVSWEDLTPRTGLMAAGILRVTLEKPGDPLPGAPGPYALLRRHLLGLTAIGVGNALGAIKAARDYASQRYQGGNRIENHPAVKLLLGEATARTEAIRGSLYWAAQEEGDTRVATIGAMALAARGLEETWKATSNALQVLGGYGYMEDYRLEKRLRDAMTLKTLPPSSRELLLMLGKGEEGGTA